MNKKWVICIAALAIMALCFGALVHLRGYQKLGKPGVKTRPLASGSNLEVVLPEQVLDYTSKKVEQSQIVLDNLPKDTSFGQRVYRSPDGLLIQLDVVLMGADRTSIHKPQICLPGQGFSIEKTEVTTIPVERPYQYNLPVIKLTTSKLPTDTQTGELHGLYVYWFVADGLLSSDPSGLRRMWLSTKNLFRTGELQRWAYVICYSVYEAGQEKAVFNRVKQFIAAAVPEFQFTPNANETGSAHP